MSRWATTLALSAALAANAAADVVSLLPNHDATLYEDPQGQLANGAGQYTFAGVTAHGFRRRALLSFDLSSLPAGANIISAELSLYMSRTATSPLPVTLHQVLSAWAEGPSRAPGEEGGGAPALPGDVTWLSNINGQSLWQTPGGDFINLASATSTVGANGFYTWNASTLARDLQHWIDNPAQNFGWLIRGFEGPGLEMTAKRFDSRENDDRSLRPALTIEYTSVPSPGTFAISALALLCFCKGRPRPASN